MAYIKTKEESEAIRDKLNLTLSLVCKKLFLTLDQVKSKKRTDNLVMARMAYTMLALKIKAQNPKIKIALSDIGKIIKRDHATILHMEKIYNRETIELEKAVEDQMRAGGFWEFAVIGKKRTENQEMLNTFEDMIEDSNLKKDYVKAVKRALFLFETNNIK